MNRLQKTFAAVLLVIGASLALQGAQQGYAPGGDQAQDPEFARLVKTWTTMPEFLSPLVDHLPLATGIPTPKDVLGHHIGEPGKLTYYAEIVDFYRQLAARSPRIRVFSIGRTDEGRECVVAAIGSEDSIRDIEAYRGYLAQLADPRKLSEAEARTVIGKAKPIYHLMGGLHSAETGPPEMLMELAYRLVAGESQLIRRIRDNVIVTISPVVEPDGRDRYVDWYYRHLAGITDEKERLPGPPFWGKYVFHDNNRDINYSQVTMRALLNWYLQWHPPVMHDLHESVPFMYTFSGQAPQNPTLDPILYGELPWFANFEMAQMIKYGMPGVWTHAFVDMWSPGYLAFMSSNHNGLVRMYETYGNGGATTMKRRVAGEGPAESGATTREWYRPLPPYKEVEWSIRNNTNYSETGVLTALELASSFPQTLLENFYRKSRNAIESGRKDAPFGYVIPSGQRDNTRVSFLVSLLRLQGIEVGRARGEVKLKEGTFPAGSYVVKRDQPYGRLAKVLLEKQDFPDPSLRTYDDTGWTMGLMLHAEVRETADKAVLDIPVDPAGDEKPAGRLDGTASRFGYAVAHFGSNRMITLRNRLKDLRVRASEKAFKAGNVEYPAGSFIIPAGQGGTEVQGRVRAAVEDLGLTGAALDSDPGVPAHELDIPRLAVFSTWGSTQEVGWVRHALDQLEVPYDLVFKERLRQGDLRASYDVVLVPSQGRSAKSIVFDIEPRAKPLPYNQTDRFRNLGVYGTSDDITGGMGLEGILALRNFVESGGLLITLGTASFVPAEYGFARGVDASRTSPQFSAPGPIIEAEVLKADHPVFYGYASKTFPVRYANGPVLAVSELFRDRYVLLRYASHDKLVLSGSMRNSSEVRNRPAILDVPAGAGRVLMFATNPCYRWQNHGEFNLLFNAILNHNDIPKQ